MKNGRLLAPVPTAFAMKNEEWRMKNVLTAFAMIFASQMKLLRNDIATQWYLLRKWYCFAIYIDIYTIYIIYIINNMGNNPMFLFYSLAKKWIMNGCSVRSIFLSPPPVGSTTAQCAISLAWQISLRSNFICEANLIASVREPLCSLRSQWLTPSCVLTQGGFGDKIRLILNL